MKGKIVLDNVTVSYGSLHPLVAIKNVSFEVSAGEVVSIVGPSGCGKSTIINTIAGFITPDSGAVSLDGKKIVAPGPDIGVVFQNFELFPWKTVAQNISFGLDVRGKHKYDKEKIVHDFIHKIGLDGFDKKYPSELSVGMAQRVGIARVVVNDPLVILFDEPFASLDFQMRLDMQDMIMHILEENHKTMIFVSHDLDETIRLSDRIIVMTSSPGYVKEIISIVKSRPRTFDDALCQEFNEVKLHIYGLIKEESEKQRQFSNSGQT